MLAYGTHGELEARLACATAADVLADLASRVVGRHDHWGVDEGWIEPASDFVQAWRAPAQLARLSAEPGPRHLGDDFDLVATTFHRFAVDRVRPHAERVHRRNADVPEEIIEGLAGLGGFGLSVPEEFGGQATGTERDYVGMVVATEELSWGSLGIGGSLVTRPEILTRALVNGGTLEQKHRWLGPIARGDLLVAVAVTEPDFGSDVASLTTSAEPVDGGWLVTGVKTWSTFAARADLLMLLARTNPDRSIGHRGLSMFVVEKPQGDGGGFVLDDPTSPGRAGPPRTDGGSTDRHDRLPGDAFLRAGLRSLVRSGRELDRRGRTASGRASTSRCKASRTVGCRRRPVRSASCRPRSRTPPGYAAERVVFGRKVGDYELTRVKLGRMAVVIQATRQFALAVARSTGRGGGALEPSMVKAYACRAAEWVTREAMQIHGGLGYAEEVAVSRYFVDARVLSIFEGADEILALKVIARRLLEAGDARAGADAAVRRGRSAGAAPEPFRPDGLSRRSGTARRAHPSRRTWWPSCGWPRRSSRPRTSRHRCDPRRSPCGRPPKCPRPGRTAPASGE